MSYVSPRLRPSLLDATLPEPTECIAMRQLRHQTKNALQRIIAQVANTDLRATPAGCALADDLERRICLSARVSDALFGLRAAPGPLRDRLKALSESTVALLADPGQAIRIDMGLIERCPAPLEPTIIQVAHEMVGNAVKHGMHQRLQGTIALRVRAPSINSNSVTLLVSDDGWGPHDAMSGEGLSIMRALSEQHGGSVSLYREADWTIARLHLPHRA